MTTSVSNTTDTNAWQADFKERLLIDYRYFDFNNISVQYEFGFGLSYTTFELSDIAISKATNATISATPSNSSAVVPGGNAELWDTLITVTATISNTGDVSGAAVPQLYVSLPATAGSGTPVQQLRGFDKISLAAGVNQTVTFDLMRRDISFWDTDAQEWTIPAGSFGINIGFSSRDFRVSGTFTI